MKNVSLTLFYILLFLLPTQLGRHFLFDFSYVSEIRSDYLTPAVYLTDVVVFLILVSWFFKRVKNGLVRFNLVNFGFVTVSSLFFVYLGASSLFVSSNFWASVYGILRIAEFFLLGCFIVSISPSFKKSLFVLNLSAMYVSVLSILQFVNNGSVGGVWWYLGERTFFASTPGVANFTFLGRSFLRPYSTMPHPNVLGGLLSLTLAGLLLYFAPKKDSGVTSLVLFLFAFYLQFVVLFLTFSQGAWGVFLLSAVTVYLARRIGENRLCAVFKKNINKMFIIMLFVFITSVLLFLPFEFDAKSFNQRKHLINVSLNFISEWPFFGAGLNNFVYQMSKHSQFGEDFFTYQPVHNIYLLTFSELGIVGFSFLLYFLNRVWSNLTKGEMGTMLVFSQIMLLGLFDHYLFTLQQGQLLFTVFASLAFLKKNA